MLNEKERKELLEKRKYYREHPKEAKKEYVKRDDGIGMIPVEKKEQKK